MESCLFSGKRWKDAARKKRESLSSSSTTPLLPECIFDPGGEGWREGEGGNFVFRLAGHRRGWVRWRPRVRLSVHLHAVIPPLVFLGISGEFSAYAFFPFFPRVEKLSKRRRLFTFCRESLGLPRKQAMDPHRQSAKKRTQKKKPEAEK